MKKGVFEIVVFIISITYNKTPISRTVRDSQLSRACLRVIGVSVVASDGADRDGVATVGISVKVAVVAIPASVSCGKHKNTALTTSSVCDTVDEGLEQDPVGTIHRFAVITGTPAARVDLCLVESVVDGLSLLHIGDFS